MPLELTAVAASPPRNAKAMALDVGRARIGLAVTDDRAEMAMAWQVLERRGTRLDLQVLLPMFAQQQLAVLVVGLPPQLGDDEKSAHLAKGFAQALANAQPLPVWLVDEADSTAEAHQDLRLLGHRAARRRREVDKHAAKVILDRWLAGSLAVEVVASPPQAI